MITDNGMDSGPTCSAIKIYQWWVPNVPQNSHICPMQRVILA